MRLDAIKLLLTDIGPLKDHPEGVDASRWPLVVCGDLFATSVPPITRPARQSVDHGLPGGRTAHARCDVTALDQGLDDIIAVPRFEPL